MNSQLLQAMGSVPQEGVLALSPPGGSCQLAGSGKIRMFLKGCHLHLEFFVEKVDSSIPLLRHPNSEV